MFSKKIQWLIGIVFAVMVTVGATQSTIFSDSFEVRRSAVLEGTFLYQKSPQLNQPAEIFFQTKANSVQWEVAKQPSGANLNLNISADTKTVTFTVNKSGVYTIKTNNSNGQSSDTTFRVSADFPFDESKIVKPDPNEPLLEAIATISNQYWIMPRDRANTDVATILANYDKLSLVGDDELRGTLIQMDENDLAALQQIEKIRMRPEIHYIRPRVYIGKNAIKPNAVQPNDYGNNAWQIPDNAAGANWHLEKINMPEAWEIEQGDPTIRIGICDNGYFAGTHEDMIDANGNSRYESIVTDTVGYDDNGNITAEETEKGKRHGMMTSGAIGAVSNNGKGISGINAISPLIAYSGKSPRTSMCLAELAADKKIKTINFSMGPKISKDFTLVEPEERISAMEKALNYALDMAVATQSAPDKLFVQAAGNDSIPAMYSAAINTVDLEYDNTIVVAAMVDNNRLAYYSNYGESVDIAAPTHYKSIGKPSNGYWEGVYGTNIDNKDNTTAFGTSAAAPVVSGVASLIYSINPDFTGEDVKKILIDSATEIVSHRYTNENGAFKPLSDFDAPEIPVLNAKAALELAKKYAAGELPDITYWMQDAFQPTVTVKYLTYTDSLVIDKIIVDGEEKPSTFEISGVGNQTIHNLTATIQYVNNPTAKTIDSVLHINRNTFVVSTEDSNGDIQPVSGADVRIYKFDPEIPGGQVLSRATTDANGQVTAYLTPGAYLINVNAAGYKTAIQTIYESKKSTVPRMRHIKMVTSDTDSGGIIGVVKNVKGEGISNISVFVIDNSTNTRVATTITDGFGNFEFSTGGFTDLVTLTKKTLPTKNSEGHLISYRLRFHNSLNFYSKEKTNNIALIEGENVYRNILLLDSSLTPQPKNLSAQWQNVDVKLSWEPVTDLDVVGYRITATQFGAPSSTVTMTIDDKATDEYIASGLASNSAYKFSIRAFRSACETLNGQAFNDCASLPSETLLAPLPPTTATKLNDTGITLCGTANSTSNSADCANAVTNASGAQIPLGQDGHYGTGKDGSKGKSFTTVSGGQCVQDNHTGLLWEVKTDDGGLHDKDNTYTWYSTSNNAGNPGTQDGGSCSGSDCDTAAFVEAVNNAGWCGYSDWRLPTRRELFSIADYSRYNPAIDTNYFPNTQSSFYWSSSPSADSNTSAWGVYFSKGFDYNHGKDNSRYVRLVRGGQ